MNAVLRRVAEREARPGVVRLPPGADPLVRLALETSHPEWLVRRWVAAFGEPAARAALEADDVDTPTDLLADPRAGSVDEILAALAADGVTAERSPWAPLALTVTEGNAAAHPLVSGGALAVVDVAAQALAALLPGRGSRWTSRRRPAGRRARSSRRGAPGASSPSSARPRAPRGWPRTSRPRAAGTRSSSSGRMRASRRFRESGSTPSFSTRRARARGRCARTRRSGSASARATSRASRPTQHRLLDAALALLAPGGALLYVTCSLEPEENEHVVDAVLAARPGFARTRPGAWSVGALAERTDASGLVRVLPGATVDGFSAILMTRLRR